VAWVVENLPSDCANGTCGLNENLTSGALLLVLRETDGVMTAERTCSYGRTGEGEYSMAANDFFKAANRGRGRVRRGRAGRQTWRAETGKRGSYRYSRRNASVLAAVVSERRWRCNEMAWAGGGGRLWRSVAVSGCWRSAELLTGR